MEDEKKVKPCKLCGSTAIYQEPYYQCGNSGCPLCGTLLKFVEWDLMMSAHPTPERKGMEEEIDKTFKKWRDDGCVTTSDLVWRIKKLLAHFSLPRIELPEKRPEYTDVPNSTNGIYSHTEDCKRWYDLERNQGFNEAIDLCQQAIDRVKGKEGGL